MRIRPFEIGDLIGERDPIEGTPLRAGEIIRLCRRSKVGYHESTITFLVQANGGHCTGCGQLHDLEQVRLPSRPIRWTARPGALAPPSATPAIEVGPVRRTVSIVRRSATGVWIIDLEPTNRPGDALRLAILPPSLPRWTERGIDPRSYEGRQVRIRGVVTDHPWLQRVMIVTDPSAIEVVDDSPIRWRTIRGPATG